MTSKKKPTSSILGPLNKRVKTDIWVDKQIRQYVENFAELLGVRRNVIFTMAVAQFAVAHAPLLKNTTKRKAVITAMQKELNRICEEMKKQV